MAFFLTPRFAPAYTQPCGPFGSCGPSRPSYLSRPVSRPSVPSFVPFLSQIDSLLSDLDREARREAQREAHRQRQQQKRAFRTVKFEVSESEQGWQVNAEVPGFDQENVSIEVTDEHTLKVAGNTEWRREQEKKAEAASAPVETQTTQEAVAEEQSVEDRMDGITLNETEEAGIATPTYSDTESHKSYQATVEDDFEDLGAEASSLFSSSSSTTASEAASPKEPKGKEKVVDEPTETAVQPTHQPGVPAQQQPEAQEDKFHGSFEKSFRFPERIDATHVQASFKNGVLRIQVPRMPRHQVRHVFIQ